MAIPAHLELSARSERRRARLVRIYLEHEQVAIAGGSLLAVLLVWEAFGASGLVDPLFISFPTRVARAAWLLSHDRDFWTDLQVSATEFILGYAAALAVAIPLGLAVGLIQAPAIPDRPVRRHAQRGAARDAIAAHHHLVRHWDLVEDC